MNLTEILDESLARAITVIQSKKEIDFPDSIRSDVDTLINKIDKNKSLVSALVTSLVKKITDPKQDIRLHRTDFRGGYSARSLDTSVTAPFFRDTQHQYGSQNVRETFWEQVEFTASRYCNLFGLSAAFQSCKKI